MTQFQDYSRTFTPLDRYRKHCIMFDYWQHELVAALQRQPFNPKLLRRASADSLTELETLKSLVDETTAGRIAPLVEERAQLNRQLQSGVPSEPQARLLAAQLDGQERRLHRDFFWRDVEDRLKP